MQAKTLYIFNFYTSNKNNKVLVKLLWKNSVVRQNNLISKIHRHSILSSKYKSISYPYLFSFKVSLDFLQGLGLHFLSSHIPLFSMLSRWFAKIEKDLIERFFHTTRSLVSHYIVKSLSEKILLLKNKMLYFGAWRNWPTNILWRKCFILSSLLCFLILSIKPAIFSSYNQNQLHVIDSESIPKNIFFRN